MKKRVWKACGKIVLAWEKSAQIGQCLSIDVQCDYEFQKNRCSYSTFGEKWHRHDTKLEFSNSTFGEKWHKNGIKVEFSNSTFGEKWHKSGTKVEL